MKRNHQRQSGSDLESSGTTEKSACPNVNNFSGGNTAAFVQYSVGINKTLAVHL